MTTKTMKRINPTKSIFIGDHVWIGQSSMILKGTKIGSGSIIGAMSLVSGKEIPSNTSWGGVPARQLETDIFWVGSYVHTWKEKETLASEIYNDNIYIFNKNKSDDISFDEIDIQLSQKGIIPFDRLDYLLDFIKQKTKNSFTII